MQVVHVPIYTTEAFCQILSGADSKTTKSISKTVSHIHPQDEAKDKILMEAESMGICIPISTDVYLNSSLEFVAGIYYSLKSAFISSASFTSSQFKTKYWRDKPKAFWEIVKTNEDRARKSYPHFESIAELLGVAVHELYRALTEKKPHQQGDMSKRKALAELYREEALKAEQEGASV